VGEWTTLVHGLDTHVRWSSTAVSAAVGGGNLIS
jgi:hypothetical protein